MWLNILKSLSQLFMNVDQGKTEVNSNPLTEEANHCINSLCCWKRASPLQIKLTAALK